MGNSKHPAVTVRLPPCCRKALANIRIELESGRILRQLVGVSPFLVLFGNSPPVSGVSIGTHDWVVWEAAVKGLPDMTRRRCENIAEHEFLAHNDGSLNAFWEGVLDSFGKKQANPAFATGFIKRFTSTFSTDEEKMAKALFEECGTDMAKVRAVFRELKRNHSSDSDDVAELYINKVKARGGPVRNALQTDRVLIALLIRILDEGVTFPGEKACIRFLKSI